MKFVLFDICTAKMMFKDVKDVKANNMVVKNKIEKNIKKKKMKIIKR